MYTGRPTPDHQRRPRLVRLLLLMTSQGSRAWGRSSRTNCTLVARTRTKWLRETMVVVNRKMVDGSLLQGKTCLTKVLGLSLMRAIEWALAREHGCACVLMSIGNDDP